MALGRNTIGFEVDKNLSNTIFQNLSTDKINLINDFIHERLKVNIDFIEKRMLKAETDFKHFNRNHNFSVMTSQEVNLILNFLKKIQVTDNQAFYCSIIAQYSMIPELNFGYIQTSNDTKKVVLK